MEQFIVISCKVNSKTVGNIYHQSLLASHNTIKYSLYNCPTFISLHHITFNVVYRKMDCSTDHKKYNSLYICIHESILLIGCMCRKTIIMQMVLVINTLLRPTVDRVRLHSTINTFIELQQFYKIVWVVCKYVSMSLLVQHTVYECNMEHETTYREYFLKQ